MPSSARIVFTAVSVSVAMCSSAPAQVVPEEFTTANGETILLPSIAEMECEEIDKVLTIIDNTRYRENAPEPHNEADVPLFRYETKLAREHYTRCVILRKHYSGGLLLMPRSKSN